MSVLHWEWRHANRILFYISLMALTRALLYIIPTKAEVPRAFNLLPEEAASLYGAMWLMAASFGLYQAFSRHLEMWARWSLSGLWAAWALISLAGAVFIRDGNAGYFAVQAFFYALLSVITLEAKIRYQTRFSTVFIVHYPDRVEVVDENDTDLIETLARSRRKAEGAG